MNKQITEDYVSYEIAKLLKEKRFPQQEYINTFPYYTQNGNLWFGDINTVRQRYWVEAIAITQSLALKWLRDIHNIDIIAPPQFDNSKWTYSAIIFKLSVPCMEIRLNDNKDKKEEAIDAALLYVLKNLI